MSKDNIWIHILNQIGYTTDKPFQIITSKEIKDSKATWQGPSCQFEPRLFVKWIVSLDLRCFKTTICI